MKYVVYGKENCPFCVRAKELLTSKGLNYEYHDVAVAENHNEMQYQKFTLTGFPAKTVPQIFRDTGGAQLGYIGGFDDLYESLKPKEVLQDSDFDFFD